MMLPLGSKFPDFSLTDVITGKTTKSSDFFGKKAVLIIFTARHCPYAQHVKDEMASLGRDYSNKGVGIVAICSSDIKAYPMDAPESLKEFAREINLNFPLCFDETQDVAKEFRAACTPDFFVYGQDFKLMYRGQLDSSRPGSDIPVSGKDVRAALDALLAGKPVNPLQMPSIGCSIKWKPGNEPNYLGGR